MSSSQYELGQLNSILESLLKKNSSGILSLKTQVAHWHSQKKCILILHDGALIYGELNVTKIPSSQQICQILGEKLNPNSINAAMKVALNQAKNPDSLQELMEILVKLKIFDWQQAADCACRQIVIILEQFLSSCGQFKWQNNNNFSLKYGVGREGLNWYKIKGIINQRQHKWRQYIPVIPAMDAIPLINSQKLTTIQDVSVRQHLVSSANGTSTLLDIAEEMGKDPLKVAKSYFKWTKNGWVNFEIVPSKISTMAEKTKVKIPAEKNPREKLIDPTPLSVDRTNPPIVLSVDDSPIIQISIKRALQEDYQVLLATNATDALKMLNKNPVELLLLDLTMPDIDGLEFCKVVRKIDKFHGLPIVMVTARDGFINKMKGQIAGSSKYLTKPFTPEQLREVVAEYILK